MIVLLSYTAYGGLSYYQQNHFRIEHQEIERASWEANRDKYSYRMAHFGTFAFRLKHPLGIFDFVIESFTCTKVRFVNSSFILEKNHAAAMRNYFFTVLDGDGVKVERTFSYILIDGVSKIDLHRSSFSFNPGVLS